MHFKSLTSASLLALCAAASTATGASLSTGSGDGSVIINFIDEFGQFNGAIYDPVGDLTASDPIFDSEVFITQGQNVVGLGRAAGGGGGDGEGDEVDGPLPVLFASNGFSVEEPSRAVSSFNINQLDFTLTQTLTDAVTDGQVSGAVLTQTYAITNIADVTNSFSLIRYLDGDLRFNDQTLNDGGGRTVQGGQEILFQTDASGQPSDADTFIGITATGGTNEGFAVDFCCGINQFPLPSTVATDANNDQFTDQPFDVTLQLARGFSLNPGETQIFSTQTLFGNGAPQDVSVPTAGLVPSQPLMPGQVTGTPGQTPVNFIFDIPVLDVLNIPQETLFGPGFVSPTIWIDPIIATGYTYSVTGAEFASVTAPVQGTGPGEVNDADGQYQVLINGVVVATLAAGNTYTFASPVSVFEITGIDIGVPGFGDGSEELDPTDPAAFNTGVALTNFTALTIQVTQSPTELFVTGTPAVIPLPSSVLLLGAGLAGLGFAARRRRAKA